MLRFTNKRRETIVSPLLTSEAYDILKKQPVLSSFCQSLLRQWERSGRLSEAQLYWFHKLALEPTTAKEQPKVEEPEGLGPYVPLLALLTAGQQCNKRQPRVKIPLPGGVLAIKLMGDRSKNAGCLAITNGVSGWRDRPNSEFYGYVGVTGHWKPTYNTPEYIKSAMEALAPNPTAWVAAFGQRVSYCVFCATQITTTESLAVGYGPVCAERFSLPWGTKKG